MVCFQCCYRGFQGLKIFSNLISELCTVDNMPLNIVQEIQWKWSYSDPWPTRNRRHKAWFFSLQTASPREPWLTRLRIQPPFLSAPLPLQSPSVTYNDQPSVVAWALLQQPREIHTVALCAKQESKYKQMLFSLCLWENSAEETPRQCTDFSNLQWLLR